MAASDPGSGLERVSIEILEGDHKKETLEARFNPTQYSLDRSVTYGKQTMPGTATPVTQFVSGDAETLSMELLFDTYEARTDVRREYLDTLDLLLTVDSDLHAPPPCQFTWGKGLEFTCVLEKATKNFTLFLADGTPVRARVNVTFSKYEAPSWEKKQNPPKSADKTSVWRVTAGDTIWQIAAEEYGDPGRWRQIAQKNQIDDPRDLTSGVELVIPPWRTQ